MLTKRLIMAAFAALFAASTSLAILQPQPATAAPDGWRAGHHARHDRDDRWKRRHPHHVKRHHRKGDRDRWHDRR